MFAMAVKRRGKKKNTIGSSFNFVVLIADNKSGKQQ